MSSGEYPCGTLSSDETADDGTWKTGVADMPVKTTKKASKKVARNVASTKALRKGTSPATPTATGSKPIKKIAKKTTTSVEKTDTRARRRSTLSTSIDFSEGSDMAIAFEEVRKGGKSRAEVSHRLAEIWKDNKTRNGNDKPVSTIMNHVVRRAVANGYEVVQTWQLVKKDPIPGMSDVPQEENAPAKKEPFTGTWKRKTHAKNAERALAEKAGVVKAAKATRKAVRPRAKV